MSMRSVGWALSWEYWRRGMFWYVPACFGLLVGFILLPGFLGGLGLRHLFFTELRGKLHWLALWPAVPLALASWTALRRFYALPVATTTLVAWSLANGAVACAATYCCTALSLNAFVGADWPLVGPALFSVAAYVVSQAALWWIGPSRGMLPLSVCLCIAAPVAARSLGIWPATPFAPEEMSSAWTASLSAVAAWFGALGASYLIAVNGVARDRRGGSWSLAPIGRWWAAVVQLIWSLGRRCRGESERGVRFRSAAAAQFRLEWRAKGRFLTLGVVGQAVFLWLFFALMSLPHYEVGAALIGFTWMLVMLSPLAGVFLGTNAGRFGLRPYIATRPLSDGALASAVLRNVAAVLGSSAVLWAIGCLVIWLTWMPSPWLDMGRAVSYPRDVAPIVLCLLAAWTLAGLGSALAIGGQRLVAWGGIGAAGVFFGLLWLGHARQPWGGTLAFMTVATACFAGTVAAFMAGRRRRVISVATIVGCLAGYLALAGFLYALLPDAAGSVVGDCLLLGFGALPVAPFAAAPLAVWWNRHQ
jgi:hypothetical protein